MERLYSAPRRRTRGRSAAETLPLAAAAIAVLVLAACSSAPKAPAGVYTVRNEAARLLLLGSKALREGDAASRGFYVEAYRLYTMSDDAEGRIRALEGVGRCLLATGESLEETDANAAFTGRDAPALWSYAGLIAAAAEDPELSALAGLLQAELALLTESTADAKAAAVLAAAAAETLKTRPSDRARALRLYGTAAKLQADYPAALKALDEAAKIDLNAKSFADHASDRYLSASIHSKMGDYPAAVAALREALDSDRRVEHASGIAGDYLALGLVAEKTGDVRGAAEYFRRADEIYTAARLEKLAAEAKARRDGFPAP